MVCPRCGAKMDANQRYCMKCGALNYDHPDNKDMKDYITDEEFEQANKDYKDPEKRNNVDKVEFAGRTYETHTKKKKGYVDTRAALVLLLIITILLGVLSYFWLEYSISLIVAICVVYFALSFYVISFSSIFMKGGYSGFSPLVPVYNLYAYFDIAVGNGWKFLLLFIPIFGIFYGIYVNYRLGKVFEKSGWLTLFFPFVMIPWIAFTDSSAYHGKGQKYVKFIEKGKRRNTQLPAFIYALAFFLVFLGFIQSPLADMAKQYFYIFDVKSAVKDIENDVVDGYYSCDSTSISVNDGEYYIPFSDIGEVTNFSFLPIRSSFNGKKLQGYIRVIKKENDYHYYISVSDGESGFENVDLEKITTDSIVSVDEVEIPDKVVTCKK